MSLVTELENYYLHAYIFVIKTDFVYAFIHCKYDPEYDLHFVIYEQRLFFPCNQTLGSYYTDILMNSRYSEIVNYYNEN